MAEDRKEVPIIVASVPGGLAETQTLIRNSGGKILRSIPEIGYTHAIVPLPAVWHMIQVQFITDIAIAGTTMFSDDLRVVQPPVIADPNAAMGSEVLEQEKALGAVWDHSRSSAAYRSTLPYLTAATLRHNPNLDPNRYMQVDRWRREHPTADGRGVTIAIFDGVGYLGHPALQWALDDSGRRVPKIAGVIDPVDHVNRNPADYFDSVDDDGQVNFSPSLPPSCPKPLSSEDRAGIWTLHWYVEQRAFCVAWNDRRKTLQLALPGETFSSTSKSITEFNHKASYLRFLVRDIFPDEKSNRNVTLFCLQDPRTNQVFVHLGQDAHSTMTATAAAGTSVLGTSQSGAAPGARILYIEPGGYRLSEMIEGVWEAASRKDVGLISITTGIDSYPNDPQPITPLLLDRISMASSKPVFVAAGNEGNALEQNARGGKVIVSVGAYEPAKMMHLFGFGDSDKTDHIAGYSASGPNPDGSWSTTVVAPAPGVTGWECGDMRPHPASARVMGNHFKVPDCWASGEGTSVTTPRAAGATALLLSEATLKSIALSPVEIRQALVDSAVPLPHTPSSWQGAGRLQITAAWSALIEEKTHGIFVLPSSSPDVAPLYPQFWRGPKEGTTIYRTRDIHPEQRTKGVLSIDADRVLSGCHAFMENHDSAIIIRSATFEDSARTLRLHIEAAPRKPGLLSTTVNLRCPGYRYPVGRIPITLAVTPSPKNLEFETSLLVSLKPNSQAFALFELPANTRLADFHTKILGGPALLSLSLGSSPLPVYSSNGYLSVSTAPEGSQNAVLFSDRPDLVAIRIEDVATSNSKPNARSISLGLHALSSKSLHKHAQAGELIGQHFADYTLASTPVGKWTAAKFEIPTSLDAITITSNSERCADIYLFYLENGRSSLWNRSGCSRIGVSSITVPHPSPGTWVVLSTLPTGSTLSVEDYEPVSVAGRAISTKSDSFRSLGAFCAVRSCDRTWPVQSLTWRNVPIPLSPLY
jgi:subtilisin family serine protease